MKALRILAGKKARAHIAQHGLQASDIRAIPAAAGGPKGLLLQHLDQYIFGDWLTHSAQPVHLVGASIGSWRVVCAASDKPAHSFSELVRLYAHEQRYEAKASRTDIDAVCSSILQQLLEPIRDSLFTQTKYQLHLLTVRGVGRLSNPQRGHALGYGRATLANLLSRHRLGHYLERVVFHHGKPLPFLPPSNPQGDAYTAFDYLPARNVPLVASNVHDVLRASGAIPMVLSPVQSIAQAPAGPYWDGGISDYHIHWPWPCLGGITLYPHFAPYIVPGWLDKWFKHRRASGEWLDNTVLLCPSDDFVRSLPKGKIPDRQDFKLYGLDWRAREAAWTQSIGAAEQLAQEFAQFVHQPDMQRVEFLN